MGIGWPGCCCGPQACPLFSDDFDRADSGTIGNGWTEHAGVWEILSNALRTASANARCTNTEPSAFSSSNSIKGRVRSSASGDLVRLLISTSTYLELKIGTGATLRLVSNGSVISTCNVTAAVDTWHSLQIDICTSALHGGGYGGVLAYLNGTLTAFTNTLEALGANIDPGFATGATVTGNVDCDDFEHMGFELYNEAQDVVLTGSPTGGSFTLVIPGYGTTSAIAWNANAAAVRTALESVLTITTFAPVATSGGALPGNSVRCFLGGTAAGEDVPLMTLGTNSLTGGTSPNVSISAFRDGDTCPDCHFCHPINDDNFNGNQVKVVSSGWANGANGSGITNLNGTFFLDHVGADCTDPATLPGAPCGCYELDVNFTVSYSGFGGPTSWDIVRIRSYGGGVEWVDSTGVVRVGGTAFPFEGCNPLGPKTLSPFTSCFRPGCTDVADGLITAAAKSGTMEAA